MATRGVQIAADVKCYYCGHISGQIIGRKHEPLLRSNFVPRIGFVGEMPRAGQSLRCERCRGPVFLEDAPPAPASTKTVLELLARETEAEAA